MPSATSFFGFSLWTALVGIFLLGHDLMLGQGRAVAQVIDRVDRSDDGTDGLMCFKERWVADPPFFISTNSPGMRAKKLEYENFRARGEHGWKETNFIPRFSLVRPLFDETIHQNNSNGLYVPVEVISTPTAEMAEQMNNSRFLTGWNNLRSPFEGTKGKQVQVGDRGYIWAGSLRERLPAGTDPNEVTLSDLREAQDSSIIMPGASEGESEVVFVISDETLLHSMDLPGNLTHQPIRFVQNADTGEYKARQCCRQSYNPFRQECFDDYIFQVEGHDGELIEFSPRRSCDGFYESLQPVDASQLRALGEIAQITDELSMCKGEDGRVGLRDLRSWSLQGLVSINYGEPEYNEKSGQYYAKGCFESVIHYLGGTSDTKSAIRENNSDTFLEAPSACAFMNFIKAYSEDKSLARYPLQVGNHMAGRDQHNTHTDASCIDIRPQKEDSLVNDQLSGIGAVDLDNGTARRYSQQKTLRLIQHAIANGATDIIYSDEDIVALGVARNINHDLPDTTVDETRIHSNHLHICFDEDKVAIKDRERSPSGLEYPVPTGENSFIQRFCQ